MCASRPFIARTPCFYNVSRTHARIHWPPICPKITTTACGCVRVCSCVSERVCARVCVHSCLIRHTLAHHTHTSADLERITSAGAPISRGPYKDLWSRERAAQSRLIKCANNSLPGCPHHPHHPVLLSATLVHRPISARTCRVCVWVVTCVFGHVFGQRTERSVSVRGRVICNQC